MTSRRRSTPYAILGLLSFCPMSGYDIRREAESSIGYFWSESYGQIYPALRELKAQGRIRLRAGQRGGHRDRHVYEITDLGKQALRRWRAEPPQPQPVRSELLLKIFFSDRESVAAEIVWIDDLIDENTAELREFRRLRRELLRENRGHPSLPFWLITLSCARHRASATVRWCRETLAALRSMEAGSERRGPKR